MDERDERQRTRRCTWGDPDLRNTEPPVVSVGAVADLDSARRRTTLLGAADDELSGGDRQARRNQIAQTRSLADGQERIGMKIHTSLLWAATL
jgi:hypothetical protein